MRQWLVHKYGEEPIAFRKWSKENDLLQESVRPKPLGWAPEPIEGGIAIKIPKLDGFNPKKWCYIPQSKVTILKQMLVRSFRKEFFSYVAQPNPAIPTIKYRILRFMMLNGIEDDSSTLETLQKLHLRHRDEYGVPEDIELKKYNTRKRKVLQKEKDENDDF